MEYYFLNCDGLLPSNAMIIVFIPWMMGKQEKLAIYLSSV
jgi:hypothetical protein